MPVAPLPDVHFRAEVYGGGAGVSVCLGGLDVQSPRRALRWLRRQAHRFADALDPDPFRTAPERIRNRMDTEGSLLLLGARVRIAPEGVCRLFRGTWCASLGDR